MAAGLHCPRRDLPALACSTDGYLRKNIHRPAWLHTPCCHAAGSASGELEWAAGSTCRRRRSRHSCKQHAWGSPQSDAPCSLESSLVSIQERHSLLPSLGLPLPPAPAVPLSGGDAARPASAPDPLSGAAEANNRRQVRVEAGNAACSALLASSGPQAMPTALPSVLSIPLAYREKASLAEK